MIYCDASLVVAVLAPEIHSAQARAWLRGQAGNRLAASPWVSVEVASALAMKQRRGALSAEGRSTLAARWRVLSRRSFHELSVEERHYGLAATLVDAGRSGLRGGDALHLAIALDHRCALATYDDDLADAARAHGVEVHGLGPRH